jgi:hypothetical protein
LLESKQQFVLSKSSGLTVSDLWSNFKTSCESTKSCDTLQAVFALQGLVRGVDAQIRLKGRDLIIGFDNDGIRENRNSIAPDYFENLTSSFTVDRSTGKIQETLNDPESVHDKFYSLAAQFRAALIVTDQKSLDDVQFPLITIAKVEDSLVQPLSLLISEVFDRAIADAKKAPIDIESTKERALPINNYALLPALIRHLDAQVRVMSPNEVLINQDCRRQDGYHRLGGGRDKVSPWTLERFERVCKNFTKDSPEPAEFSNLLKDLKVKLANLYKNGTALVENLSVPDYFPVEAQQFYKPLLNQIIQDIFSTYSTAKL